MVGDSVLAVVAVVAAAAVALVVAVVIVVVLAVVTAAVAELEVAAKPGTFIYYYFLKILNCDMPLSNTQ